MLASPARRVRAGAHDARWGHHWGQREDPLSRLLDERDQVQTHEIMLPVKVCTAGVFSAAREGVSGQLGELGRGGAETSAHGESGRRRRRVRGAKGRSGCSEPWLERERGAVKRGEGKSEA